MILGELGSIGWSAFVRTKSEGLRVTYLTPQKVP